MPYYRRASEFRNHRDYGRAIAEYDAAIRVDRDNMRAYISRGFLYYLRKEYDPAIADYTTAMNLDPRLRVLAQRKFEGSAAGDHYLAQAYARRGDALHKKGEDDMAIADYDAAIGYYPRGGQEISRAYYERGLIYYGKGECDLAIADFSNAIRFGSYTYFGDEQAESHYHRGLAYLDKGEHNLAIADFDEVIELGPSYINIFLPDVYEKRGEAYEAKKPLNEQSINDFRQANRLLWADEDTELAEDEGVVYADRARHYWNEGKYDLAIAAWTSSIEIDPDDAAGYHNRGLVYLDKGEYDSAIADFDTAIRIDPGSWVSYEYRDRAYIARGNPDPDT